MRRNAAAVSLLVAQFWCALAAPLLHQLHHARFGADHTHENGAIHTRAHRHARFDADLETLDLVDVASAGSLTVDCGLAEYTLVSCDEAAAQHAPNFGDALPDEETPPPDPSHGRGSIEHLAALLLPSSLILLPPPFDPTRAPVPEAPRGSSRPAPRVAHPGRAPPPPPKLA